MHNQPVADKSLVACPHCDLLQRLPDLEPGASARCPRCDKELWRRRVDPLDRTLALALAAARALRRSRTRCPCSASTAVGRAASTTVFGGAQQLWHDGREIVAVLVLFTAVDRAGAADRLHAGDRARRAPRRAAGAGSGSLLRHHPTTRTWSMIEVMMLGVLVALIKIAELRDGDPGPGAVRARRRSSSCSPPSRRASIRARSGTRIEWARRDADSALARAGRRRRRRERGRLDARCSTACSAARPAACCRARAPGEQEGRCPRCGEALDVPQARQPAAHLGVPDRRGDLLRPGEPAAGADDAHRRRAASPTPSCRASCCSGRRRAGRSR